MNTTVGDVLDGFIIELARRVGYVFDKSVGRYRNLTTGVFVKTSTVLQHVERSQSAFFKRNMRQATQRFIDGSITLDVWQTRMAREIKDAYRLNMIVGKGGIGNVTPADWGRVGGHLRGEYAYLNGLAHEVKAGQISEKMLMHRASMYSEGATKIFWSGLTEAQKDAGFTRERRVLNPAEHCADCDGYAQEGWQVIGYFPPPGVASVCGNNCQCTMEYATEAAAMFDAMKMPEIGAADFSGASLPIPPGGYNFKSIDELQTYMTQSFEHIAFDLGGMDVKAANQMMQRFHELADEFPDVAARLRHISTLENADITFYDPVSRSMKKHTHAMWKSEEFMKDAAMMASEDGTGILINPHIYRNADEAYDLVRTGAKLNWTTAADDTIDLAYHMTHEFGHQYNNWLKSLTGVYFVPVRDVEQGLGAANWDVADVKESWYKKVKFPKAMSEYGTVNVQEGFAEGFTSLYYPKGSTSFDYYKHMDNLVDATKTRAMYYGDDVFSFAEWADELYDEYTEEFLKKGLSGYDAETKAIEKLAKNKQHLKYQEEARKWADEVNPFFEGWW